MVKKSDGSGLDFCWTCDDNFPSLNGSLASHCIMPFISGRSSGMADTTILLFDGLSPGLSRARQNEPNFSICTPVAIYPPNLIQQIQSSS